MPAGKYLHSFPVAVKNSTNSKKMGDNINLLMHKKRPSSVIDILQVNGENLHQPASIWNAINKYFCNVLTVNRCE